MHLQPGDTFGRYTIQRQLGAGGMGVVYHAVDTRLGRAVALKLVRADAWGGPSDVYARTRGAGRLVDEARAAALLDHANAVTIYDVGEADGTPYIAMELVAGRALRDHVGDAAVPLTTRIGWLVDVARALDAAHARGIVHRDIKPENVMIRPDGAVKVLDFGIARMIGAGDRDGAGGASGAGGEGDADPEPWRTAVSHAGGLAGTPRYMAPEQLEGGLVDGRTDQFAWGVMAYELLARTPPWAGDLASYTQLLERIERDPRPLREVAPDVPAGVERVVARAMSRKSADRFASMAEIATALRPWLASGTSVRARVVAIGAAVAVTSLIAAAALTSRARRDPPAPASASAPLPSAVPPAVAFALHPTRLRRMTFGEDCEEFPSFTPDGKELVFDATHGADSSIVALTVATGALRAITTVRGWDFAADVSPDGASVAFLRAADDGVGTWVARIDGTGAPRFIAAGQLRPAFSPDGTAVWAGEHLRPTRYDLATGAATRAVDSPPGIVAPRGRERDDGAYVIIYPNGTNSTAWGLAEFAPGGAMRWLSHDKLGESFAFAPDGRFTVTSRLTEASNYELVAIPRAGGEATGLANRDVAPSAGVAFSRDGSALAWSTCHEASALVRIDEAGRLVPLHQGVDWAETALAPIPGTRRIAVVSRRDGATAAPWVVDRDGASAPRRLDAPMTNPAGHLAVSPDGALVAVQADHGIVLAPLDGGKARALTSLPTDAKPTFRAGGRDVVFTRADGDAPPRVFVVPVAGGEPRPLLEPGTSEAAPSPTGDRVAYLAGKDSAHLVPMVADLATGRRARLSPKLGEGRYRALAFSPDGRRVALLSGPSGVVEIDVATGAIARTVTTGSSMVQSLVYGGGGGDGETELLASRAQWVGDVWMADLR